MGGEQAAGVLAQITRDQRKRENKEVKLARITKMHCISSTGINLRLRFAVYGRRRNDTQEAHHREI